MLKDAVIDMKSVCGCGEDKPETIKFSTDGYYSYEDAVGCLTYEESDVTGMSGTRTSVIVMPDCVVVDRDGSISSRMIFREGEKSSFLYDTPYGQTTMGISTRKINHSFNEAGGHVDIDYIMDFDHKVATRNRFSINVKKSGERNNA